MANKTSYKVYTIDDLEHWARRDPARRFEIKWNGIPRSTPLTSRGGFTVWIWSRRSYSKQWKEPVMHYGRGWELNVAIRQALVSYGEKLE